MIRFNKVNLTECAKGKIVLLYVGCKLRGIDKTINELTNEAALAGATGKKLTFSTPHAIYEVQELIDFACDYIYEEMEKILYMSGRLNISFIESIGGINKKKAIFLSLINKIFDFEFFNEIGDEDLHYALNEEEVVVLGEHHTRKRITKRTSTYKFTALVEKAVNEYGVFLS